TSCYRRDSAQCGWRCASVQAGPLSFAHSTRRASSVENPERPPVVAGRSVMTVRCGVAVAVRCSRSCCLQTLVSYCGAAAVVAARCDVACSVRYVAAGDRRAIAVIAVSTQSSRCVCVNFAAICPSAGTCNARRSWRPSYLGLGAVKRQRHMLLRPLQGEGRRSQYCGPTDDPKHTEPFHDRSSILILAPPGKRYCC